MSGTRPFLLGLTVIIALGALFTWLRFGSFEPCRMLQSAMSRAAPEKAELAVILLQQDRCVEGLWRLYTEEP